MLCKQESKHKMPITIHIQVKLVQSKGIKLRQIS